MSQQQHRYLLVGTCRSSSGFHDRFPLKHGPGGQNNPVIKTT